MNIELEQKIIKKCPLLFANYGKPITETCISFGIDTGEGWFNLIEELCLKIEKIISKMPTEEQEHCKASQIKSKFASLRFYMTCETEEITELIIEAEKKSSVTCELCGKPGSLYNNSGWLWTLCSDCINKKVRSI